MIFLSWAEIWSEAGDGSFRNIGPEWQCWWWQLRDRDQALLGICAFCRQYLGLMLCCHHPEIFNHFWIRGPTFSFCTCCCSVSKSCPALCEPMNCSTPGFPVLCSNSCPFSQWRHPTISSSVVPFSSCLQSFPASGSFPLSQLFASGGQSIGVSASASILPMNNQDWSPLRWTGWISFQSNGLSDKQKMRDFTTTKPALQQILKDLL